MMLKSLELHGFKSFAKKVELVFDEPITAIVGPNGSGKSNIVEAMRFVLGEQSIKSLRGASGKDLIFNGSQKIPKMSRARATITFDNKERKFNFSNAEFQSVNVDFDEISLSREVLSDGTNTYRVNGSEVRMKDVVELIASVHIGSSGHHIISQGEADRLLNAQPKERREIIEDALGLKLYHFRIKESERKLIKTQEHMREVLHMRREIAPHLAFLKKQVEKIEKAKILRQELEQTYRIYFTHEFSYIQHQQVLLDQTMETLQAEKNTLESAQKPPLLSPVTTQHDHRIEEYEHRLREIRQSSADIARSLGKYEGMLEMAQSPMSSVSAPMLRADEVQILLDEVDTYLDDALQESELFVIQEAIYRVKEALQDFRTRHHAEAPVSHTDRAYPHAQELQAVMQTLRDELDQLRERERDIESSLHGIREARMLAEQEARRHDQARFERERRIQDVENRIRLEQINQDRLREQDQHAREMLHQAESFFGNITFDYVPHEQQASREDQHERRRGIERLLVKLEDSGGGSGHEIMQEYEETYERDQFLAREITDMENSIKHLQSLITDLQSALDRDFKQGVIKITTYFHDFFTAMFGGGTAELKVISVPSRRRKALDEGEEEAEQQEGIEIAVQLPRKKVTALEMLSGGERSLTSIALLFALSQVNPPPFLVLDETDAALDEANSRRYGDMIQRLSQASQLIVVTHNRETMSRAHILYGITISKEGCSQLLSVKFDEAEAYAK